MLTNAELIETIEKHDDRIAAYVWTDGGQWVALSVDKESVLTEIKARKAENESLWTVEFSDVNDDGCLYLDTRSHPNDEMSA